VWYRESICPLRVNLIAGCLRDRALCIPKPDPERDKQDESNSFPYLGTCGGGIKKLGFLEPLSTKGEPPFPFVYGGKLKSARGFALCRNSGVRDSQTVHGGSLMKLS
jgi:hypothetical protein